MARDTQDMNSQRQTIAVSQLLATYAVDMQWSSIPSPVIHEAKRALIDALGVAIAGSRDPVVEKTLAVYAARGGRPEARLVGRDDRMDVLSATLLNGVATHALDFDDTHADFFYHGTVPVAPVVWALGESIRCSGREFLTAFVAGWEVGARIGRAVYPSLYHKGWQGTSTVGTFAAAVAAGKLLKLDAKAMCNALGLAAAQAGGTRQMLGTMTKPFQVGKAAMNGLLAAMLSKEGVTSSLIAIEGPLGFAALTAPSFDLTGTVQDFATRYELLRNTYKPYSCCLKHHPVVDAFLELRRKHGVTPPRLQSAVCTVYPALLDSANVDEPVTGPQGKFSVQHSAAVALTDNLAMLAQYTTQRVLDPKLAELRHKLSFIPDARMASEQCEVTANCNDGASVTVRINGARGGIANPLSDKDIEGKFRESTNPYIDASRQDRVLASIHALDAARDIAAVVAAW